MAIRARTRTLAAVLAATVLLLVATGGARRYSSSSSDPSASPSVGASASWLPPRSSTSSSASGTASITGERKLSITTQQPPDLLDSGWFPFDAATANAASSSGGAGAGTTRIVSIPLIPHHVHEARVRRRGRRGRQRRQRTARGGRQTAEQQPRRRQEERAALVHPRRLHETDDDHDHDEDHDEDEEGHDDEQKGKQVQQEAHPLHPQWQMASLFQGYGTHYADLWCGTPQRQRQTVIVDTGSGVTAFPVVGCGPDNCGVPKYHLNPLYDPSNSTTFERISCAECQQGYCSKQNGGTGNGESCLMSMSYAEGSSWSAYQCREDVYVGGLHGAALPPPPTNDGLDEDALNPYEAPAFAFPLVLGCQTKLTGLFKTQLADGIMGMDRGGLAFWAQMSRHLGIVERKFSLCFSRSPTASRNGTNAGAMTLGGTDERLHATPMVHSAIGSGSGFYDVTIRQMYLREGSAGESALYDPAAKTVPLMKAGESMSGIVDSGTTDSYFSKQVESAFNAAWLDMVKEAYSHSAVQLSESELHSRPTLLIQLAGDAATNQALAEQLRGQGVPGLAGSLDPDHPYDILIAVPASHAYEYDDEADTYTARVYFEGGSRNVIGANSIMGHDVFFDVDNNRIGWSESDCNYRALAQPFIDNQGRPASGSNSWSWDSLPFPSNCSSTCQLGVVAGVVSVALGLLIVCVVVRRRRSQRWNRSSYDLAQANELELGEIVTSPSSDSHDDDGGGGSSSLNNGVPYTDRHEPSHFEIGDVDDDEEEFRSGNGVLS